jgi:hypothetical protein
LDWDEKEQFSGIWNLYQSLIRLRRNWFNNTRGLSGQHVNVFHVNDTDKVIAYHRWQNGGKGDDVIIVANFGNRSYDSYTIGFQEKVLGMFDLMVIGWNILPTLSIMRDRIQLLIKQIMKKMGWDILVMLG